MRHSRLRWWAMRTGVRSTVGLVLGALVLVGVMAIPSGASGSRVESPSAVPEPPTVAVPQLPLVTVPEPPATLPARSPVTLPALSPATLPVVPRATLPVLGAAAPSRPAPGRSEPVPADSAATAASAGGAGAALAPAVLPVSLLLQAPGRVGGTQTAPRRGLVGALRAARSFVLFLVLAAVVVVFLAVQGRLDRRDPKLAAAPVNADTLRFS